jgi:hypothetical protein
VPPSEVLQGGGVDGLGGGDGVTGEMGTGTLLIVHYLPARQPAIMRTQP